MYDIFKQCINLIFKVFGNIISRSHTLSFIDEIARDIMLYLIDFSRYQWEMFQYRWAKYINPKLTTIRIYTNSILWLFRSEFLKKINFIPNYYSRSENLWGDGFLFDFLQKKTADLWIRYFVIYTGFLFSERLVFDAVIRLYIDNIIWPFHTNSIFESSSISEMLVSVLFLYITLFFVLISTYIFFII